MTLQEELDELVTLLRECTASLKQWNDNYDHEQYADQFVWAAFDSINDRLYSPAAKEKP